MYKCEHCNKRTESIDVPPCSEDHVFTPVEIPTIHKFILSSRGKIILCTEKPPRNNTIALGGNYGISCIRCKRKMAALLSPGTGEAVDLPDGQNPDKLLSDLE